MPHRIDGVRARGDGLGLHGLHRPRSGNLAEAVEVALEPEPSDQPLDAPPAPAHDVRLNSIVPRA